MQSDAVLLLLRDGPRHCQTSGQLQPFLSLSQAAAATTDAAGLEPTSHAVLAEADAA